MTLAEARRILEKAPIHSKALVEKAQEVVATFASKKVQGRRKVAYGGTVGKPHMYVAGGSVTNKLKRRN